MAAPRLTSHDKKDLDKFTKYLVYKCIQIIVQSRLGERVKTQSKPVSSGSDWVGRHTSRELQILFLKLAKLLLDP